ncbi:MAG TPA: enoyl-CoA hydratase/isomerase family protein [Syntrophobacteria bacterium]|nr:enoyl-CoA hydratase/isomerase family protein [Syntrophobacteria bacterium]
MSLVQVSRSEGIGTVSLTRGKLNPLNEPLVEELDQCLRELEEDPKVRAVIVTAQGKFFSFGFDIVEFLTYPREPFIRYLMRFTDLYTYLFLFPKPVLAALNGHAIAAGCTLVMACDYRIMAAGKAKIAFNEITLGLPIFAGSIEMLKFCVGPRKAESILTEGAMYSARQAKELGLIDQVSPVEQLGEEARTRAKDFAKRDPLAFRSIKALLRKPTAEEMTRREKDSILEFARMWHGEAARKSLGKLTVVRPARG